MGVGRGNYKQGFKDGALLIIPRYFCAVYDYAGKADLSNGFWNPKRKLVVTTHFPEIIKLQSEKNADVAFSRQKKTEKKFIRRLCL